MENPETTTAPVEPMTTTETIDYKAKSADLQGQLDKLLGKNSELRQEKVTVNENNSAMKAQQQAYEEKIALLQSSELRSNEQFDDALKLRQETFDKKAEAFGTSLAEKDAALTGLNTQLSNLLIDGEYSKLLNESGVMPHMATAAVHVLKARGALLKDNQAVVGDKSLADDFSEWIASPEAKGFLAATQNSSSGSTGSADGSTNPNPSGKSFDKMTLTERGALFSSDPELYDQMSKASS